MKRGPERVGKILSRVLKEAGIRPPDAQRALTEAFLAAAGEEIADLVQVVSFRRGVLTVEVRSAALRQELELYRKEELLASLRESVRDGFVQDLRFRLV